MRNVQKQSSNRETDAELLLSGSHRTECGSSSALGGSALLQEVDPRPSKHVDSVVLVGRAQSGAKRVQLQPVSKITDL